MAHETAALPPGADLAAWVRDARQRTSALLADLSDEQVVGPRLSIVNPLLWELGHIAWFQEKWVLRRAGATPLQAEADGWYDPAVVPHASRWDVPLPGRAAVAAYAEQVRDQVQRAVEQGLPPADAYFVLLALFYEDLQGELLLAARQTLGYPALPLVPAPAERGHETQVLGALAGDVAVPGGMFPLGAAADEPFAFDNEHPAHAVEVPLFHIARAPVTQAEFAAFAERGGYYRPDVWSPEGWQWRQAVDAKHPIYWKRATGGAWMRRHFDTWLPLEPHHPVQHVNWFEAEAYCRWVGRRLPTEAEWEAAAVWAGDARRRFPWGAAAPTAATANLDGSHGGLLDVAALPAGDSPGGCRQMLGNVWEWTAGDFGPYPGFAPGPFAHYSEPSFGTHKVLRGGSWATRARALRASLRLFHTPERRDLWAGFRTCAINV